MTASQAQLTQDLVAASTAVGAAGPTSAQGWWHILVDQVLFCNCSLRCAGSLPAPGNGKPQVLQKFKPNLFLIKFFQTESSKITSSREAEGKEGKMKVSLGKKVFFACASWGSEVSSGSETASVGRGTSLLPGIGEITASVTQP